MAGILAIAQSDEVGLSSASPKTVLQLVAPANQRLKVLGWGVFFDGVTASNEPAQVEVMRQTTAGTMTSLTPVLIGVGSETLQATAQHTATSEPTAGDVLDTAEVHPQTGYEVIYPLGQEILIPGAGRLGVKITAPDAVNVRAKFKYEE